MKLRWCGWSSFGWGLFEALGFFIVPDVLISYWSVKGWRAALLSMFAVVFGAIFGVMVLYVLLGSGVLTIDDFYSLWEKLPGFYPKMTVTAHEMIQNSGGAKGFILGPQSGIPFRIFVTEAFTLRVPLAAVILWTPVARLERLFLAPLVVVGIRAIFKRLPERILTIIITLYWIGLYYWYWCKFLPSHYSIG